MTGFKRIFMQELFIGFVSKVTTEGLNVHIPSSERITKFLHLGDDFHGGMLNSYVVVEGEKCGFIGKVISTEIPEKERLQLSELAISEKNLHPLVKIEIQTLFDYYSLEFKKSISDYPNVGAKVYHARKEIIDEFIKKLEVSNKLNSIKTSNFATLLNNPDVKVDVSLQALFSRHFAILGTTGGGKSWTTAKLVESIVENNQKVVLLDPTGEYSSITQPLVEKGKAQNIVLCNTHSIPYKQLTIEDLFFLTEPSEKSQKPKMFEAIRTLKLLELKEEELVQSEVNYIENENGNKCLIKENNRREPLISMYARNYSEINTNNLNFNIYALSKQIEKECVWETGRTSDVFGGKDASSLGHCVTLIGRINNLLKSQRYNEVFDFESTNRLANLLDSIDLFLTSDKNLLCIDLSLLPFEFNIREIVVNIIGERFLSKARNKEFSNEPLVVMLDEAHQFLNKKLNGDYDTFSLNAFDKIAKEGRKYGLFLGITTQIPRDIPLGTLSQIGTFIVHRLINYRDKEVIANALSLANRDILSYLPDLGSGEAILSSIELKLPLLVKIFEPLLIPESNTPLFKVKE